MAQVDHLAALAMAQAAPSYAVRIPELAQDFLVEAEVSGNLESYQKGPRGTAGHMINAPRVTTEIVRVPTIIRWPNGAAEPGRRVDAFVSHTDFAPTFLELVGVTSRTEHSGRGLLPWLRGEAPSFNP